MYLSVKLCIVEQYNRDTRVLFWLIDVLGANGLLQNTNEIGTNPCLDFRSI